MGDRLGILITAVCFVWFRIQESRQKTLRPICVQLHQRMLASYSTARRDVLSLQDRFDVPTSYTLPSQREFNAAWSAVRPELELTPQLRWAAVFSAIFHRFVEKPTVSKCLCFGKLAEDNPVFLLADTDGWISYLRHCEVRRLRDGWRLNITFPCRVDKFGLLASRYYDDVVRPGDAAGSGKVEVKTYDLDWGSWDKDGTAKILDGQVLFSLITIAPKPSRSSSGSGGSAPLGGAAARGGGRGGGRGRRARGRTGRGAAGAGRDGAGIGAIDEGADEIDIEAALGEIIEEMRAAEGNATEPVP